MPHAFASACPATGAATPDPESAAHSLDAVFRRVLDDYQSFSFAAPVDGAKDFSAHHTACKAALAHLTALVRLQRLLQKDSSGTSASNKQNELDLLLQQARLVLAQSFTSIQGKEHDTAQDQL